MYIQTRKEKRERAREPIRIRTPANSWLSQPDPSQGMGLRSGRVTSRVKERMGNQQSELASERANWRPREQIGVRESKLASERVAGHSARYVCVCIGA
jgi:hypothetical protein